MANSAIRAGLEVKLKSLSANFPTSWENLAFKTVDGSPWQEVWLLFAKPENPSFGDDFYRQRGYLQVDLKYPQNKGPGDAGLRADLLQRAFHRGLSMTADGITTIVEETPEIGRAYLDGDRYVVPVFIRFYANIQPRE